MQRFLILIQDDISSKGRFNGFLQNVSSYTATIPPPSESNTANDDNDPEEKNSKVISCILHKQKNPDK